MQKHKQTGKIALKKKEERAQKVSEVLSTQRGFYHYYN